ncbi:MAG TPA: VWA domain-containing protein, partial [Puia sp.]|nr:VWA domain-containing protein [Puia sp.]
MNWSELKHIITQIDWQQFHFLRPKALLLFYVLLAIVLLLILANRERKKWKHSIAPALRPFMFSRGSSWALVFPLLLFVLGMSCAIIGLAGPTWKKVDIPGEKVQAVVLIALDLSRSMDAKDIQPSRLERAKFKISDLLDQNPRARAGLIAFAGTPHPVLPFTSDYKLVKYQAKSLESRVMPVPGSNIHLLMQLVDTMMRPVSAPSTVLLMTDAIQADDVPELLNWVNGSVHRLEILLFSTPNGAEVPGHAKVISRQDPSVVQNLSNDPKVTITTITLDKSDVEGVAKR